MMAAYVWKFQESSNCPVPKEGMDLILRVIGSRQRERDLLSSMSFIQVSETVAKIRSRSSHFNRSGLKVSFHLKDTD